jgi:uncharacterized membrane protein HdeD (DUF308 family)
MLGAIGFLDSREKATVLWTVVLLVYAWRKDHSIVPSLFRVLRSMFAAKLSLVWAVAAAYAATLVLAADEADLWDGTAIKATVYWFVGTAAVLTGNALTVRSFDRKYARRLLRKAVRFTIIVEFLLNLYVMPLAAELVFVPLIGLFVLMQVVAEHDPKLTNVKTFLDRTLMLVGFGLMTWVIVRVATDLHGLLTRENAERLLLPPAFTLAFVPALYGMWRWSQWDRERIMRRWREERLAA